ncbi:[protein-PII] uridylyltransferase [Aestuariispira insulae]|uniref:Bifunctional uridylyltransferase/uridylyl-removing enzyme n=1 Tax=Aestuariispira insulae TaxID=1461337 RepID=A0A3D9HE12_9PROT|nr:[protein-PII] uridylyltransferase [Aestuariispira insulae]RED47727.1 UTP--GlnB (protein PII) uridylyltransferase GlnD [Aestuariispira insulae]
MYDLKNRRKIINRQGLLQDLEAVLAEDLPPPKRRAKWLALYKQALNQGYDEVKRRFMEDHNGALAVIGNSYVIDQILRTMYEVASRHLYPSGSITKGEALAIVAVGGFGRGELAPQSDVDLLFLHAYKLSPRVEQIVEDILYMLWDLGLKVGQSTRSIDECLRQAKADWTICTAILEARYIVGEKSLFAELQKQFAKSIMDGKDREFLEAKLSERDERHARLGDTRYVLEPNIKDGKGGLRDLHTLYWITKFLYRVHDISELVDQSRLTKREAEHFAKAQQFLWTLRCHLHYLTGRPEERLTFDVQPELASRMGYTDHAGASGVERFMKHYFLIAKEVGDLTRIFCATFEASSKRRRLLNLPMKIFRKDIDSFPVEGGRLTIEHAKRFEKDPVDMLRIFRASQRNRIDIHPDALKSITRKLRFIRKSVKKDETANRIFLDILTAQEDPETTLRHMNECGLLGKFLPDFGRVVAQMQYDMYHVYTTDEHTIRAIGILNRIENGQLNDDHPVASQIIGKVLSRKVLYVAVLLHDIAKGRGGDHSILGADVAREVCPQLGFSSEQTETVAWLVLHHLLMSETAFRRDLGDPKTIQDFVDQVQSPERLRLLLCLTVVDIRAVGPKVWNNWKATLLRELYYRAEDLMSGGLMAEGRSKRAEAAANNLREALPNWPADDLEDHLSQCNPAYLLSYPLESLVRHVHLIKQAEGEEAPLCINMLTAPERDVTEVTIYAADHPGLFSRLSGAMAVCGASIVDARIHTFANGMALDTFLIQNADGVPFGQKEDLKRLDSMIRKVLSGAVRPLQELEKRAKSGLKSRTEIFTVQPRVLIDNKASNTHTVIEVNGRDRPGFLFEVTSTLTRLGLQIAKAKISTFGEQVVDVFYVKDVFGMKIDHDGKLKQIRETLVEVLAKHGAKNKKEKKKPVAAE